MISVLPYVLSYSTLAIVWMAGNDRTRNYAWYLGLAMQAAWVGWSLSLTPIAWGFITATPLWVATYVRNRWWPEFRFTSLLPRRLRRLSDQPPRCDVPETAA